MRVPGVALWVGVIVVAVVLGIGAMFGLIAIANVIDPFREEYDDTPREYVRILIPALGGLAVTVLSMLIAWRFRRRSR